MSTHTTIERLIAEHSDYRTRCLNLIASENVISDAVAGALQGDLEGRYADFTGTDLTARKYQGGRYVVEIEQLCSQMVCDTFGAESCEIRPLSGHIAGSAVIMGLCRPGDLVLEIGSDGGGHRLAAKLMQAPLTNLQVDFLPFDPLSFNVDAAAAAAQIRERRPRLVILGSSTFLHPHPVAALAPVCREVGADLVYDASHVLGLLAAGRFQDPLREGATLVFGSTHKTLLGPQGGLIFGDAAKVAAAATGLYPALVTNHHPFRIPALALALAEHAEFGQAYADTVIANAQAFAKTLEAHGVNVVGGGTESHAVLIATPDRSGAEGAAALEDQTIIANGSRLPAQLGGQGIRFGVQELTRRGATPELAERAATLTAAALAGESVAAEVSAFVGELPGVGYTWVSR
jgi:glycine hydroxymethyltransferase